ncbi:DUF6344 domain-containing protein [Streptomyces sp. NPDC054829]|nr:DUF6344 domain-containing protein [Streptomyces sp. SBE_14.2]
MTGNRVMTLWTAVVSAFLALFTALGLISATTATAVAPRTDSAPDTGSDRDTTSDRAEEVTVPALSPWPWAYVRSLPPTMKQRIRAEAHGKTPTCRKRPLADTETESRTAPVATLDCEPAEDATRTARIPLQR